MQPDEILTTAAGIVSGDREKTHGVKETNFNNIATMWNAWLSIRREPSAPLTPHDVAQMLSMMKKARTQSGSHNSDDFVDDAGYTGIAGALADIDSDIKPAA